MQHPVLLGVNVDHVATVRQARYRLDERSAGQAVEPDPVFFAQLAEQAGADGITMHLREDRRHIGEEDVRRARRVIATRLNLEMACTPEMTRFTCELLPDAACLVPENRQEITTEGGLDIVELVDRVGPVIQELSAAGIEVSCFIDPDVRAVEMAERLGSPVVELHTGAYAEAYFDTTRRTFELDRLMIAAERANELGLVVNLGHGVNYHNVTPLRKIPGIHEMNIGHSIVSRALLSGVREAVGAMKALLG